MLTVICNIRYLVVGGLVRRANTTQVIAYQLYWFAI